MDLSKHYIHEIVSLDRAACFALENNTQKQLHSSSKLVSPRSLRFRGIQMYKINFVCRVIYARAVDRMRLLRTYVFAETHSWKSTIVHYPQQRSSLEG